MLCKEHVLSHIGDMHQPSNLYYIPSYNERHELALNLHQKIKNLEAKKVNKIKESYLELEKIINNLKNIVDSVEKDIEKLHSFIKKIIVAPKFSRFDKTCYLFNSTYESTIKTLENYQFINPEEIISKFSYIDNQLCQDLHNLKVAQNEEPKVIWSKLGENGEFAPYSQAENEIIENNYQKGETRSYIGDRNSSCYINLKCPTIEVQENSKKAVTVIRNDSTRASDSYKSLNSNLDIQWYFQVDKGWEKMTSEASRIAEWAFQNNFHEALVQNRNSYKIDVKEMKQTNLRTNYKRDIKRGDSSENKRNASRDDYKTDYRNVSATPKIANKSREEMTNSTNTIPLKR
mmetsp:Transcript_28722/g.28400  ORF Transcript_28722/g.28400 Transcript_28722/m.28400 type:complete len:346 (+) Transcript_28722:85-1122(+)